MNDSDHWMSEAKTVSSLSVDMVFLLNDQFTYSKSFANRKLKVKGEGVKETLTLPDGLTEDDRIGAQLMYARQAELIRHYDQVLELTQKYEMDLSQLYFSVRPCFYSRDSKEEILGFPWYDTFGEAKELFSSLLNSTKEILYSDADQHWAVRFVRKGNNIFVREWDPDEFEYSEAWVFDYEKMCLEVKAALITADQLIKDLSAHFNKDYWSEYWHKMEV